MARANGNGLLSLHTARINALFLCLFHVFAPLVKALPLVQRAVHVFDDEDLPKDPADASLWAYLGIAVALVLLGGAFAGL
jgi:metal transporter CNNM